MLRVGSLLGTAKVGAHPPTAHGWAPFGYPGFEDAIRSICTACGWERGASTGGRILAVTSALPGEGKSFLSEAIALSMALDHDRDVLLVECDMRAPTLADDFALSSAQGLADALTGHAPLNDVVRLSRLSNLWLLPAGAAPPNPSRLLRSEPGTELWQELRRHYAFTILDLPAALATSDAGLLARAADETLLVVRAGTTRERDVQRAIDALAGARLCGLVLNRWQTKIPPLVRRLLDL